MTAVSLADVIALFLRPQSQTAADMLMLCDYLADQGIDLRPADDGAVSRARAFLFFYEHAGYNYQPAAETETQGRARCAADLAIAEDWAADEDCREEWVPDEDGGYHDEEPAEEYWGCVVTHPDGESESLWGIGDPSREYRRVVGAEMASLLMDRMAE